MQDNKSNITKLGKPYDPNVLLTVIERALGTDLQ